jgi:hypothetical protein
MSLITFSSPDVAFVLMCPVPARPGAAPAAGAREADEAGENAGLEAAHEATRVAGQAAAFQVEALTGVVPAAPPA